MVAAPRIRNVPDGDTTLGDQAIELARFAGLELDSWQEDCVRAILGIRDDGRWASFEGGFCLPRQNGKGPHELGQRVLTTGGWTTFADIKVGDYVYGSDGRPTAVVGVSPVYPDEACYEVEFTDGARYVVGSGHLWHVKNKNDGGWRDVDTATLARSVGGRRRNGRMEFNWRVRCDAVVQSPPADLPIDPYVLGLWLGDGKSTGAVITAGDEDKAFVVGELEAAGYLVGEPRVGNAEWRPWQIPFYLGRRWNPDGFLPQLRALGVYGDKRIPEAYLTAGVDQRLALLQGLMDSDGSIALSNRSPQVEFSTSIDALAADFQRLARSLGVKVRGRQRVTSHKDSWRFLWTPTFNPFRLPRKAAKFQEPIVSSRHETMSITAIRPVESRPTRCIQVAADDGVYLVGEHFTPTHNSIIECLELAGLWLVDSDELQIHTAHLFPTAREGWRRIVGLIEGTPELLEDVRRVNRAHGEEGIELTNGKRLLFKARGSGSGRGFSGDRVILDESMFVKETMVGDLMPALSARPNPQVLYFGSAVDRLVHPDGVVFARIRERGIKGDDRLAYFEWSLDYNSPDDVPASVAADPGAWAEANPAFGIRIDAEFTESERRTMSPRTFAVERLGVGDWPETDPDAGAVIPLDVWRSGSDPSSVIDGRVVLAFDVSPDRSCAAIAAGGLRDDGIAHGEVIDRGAGTGWIVPRLVELKAAHNVSEIVCDGAGPAAAVADECKRAGIRVTVLSTRDFVRACGGFFDRVANGSFRHLGEGVLEASVRGAVKRPLGDAWAWSRKGSVDATPLVAVTLAVSRAGKRQVKPMVAAWD